VRPEREYRILVLAGEGQEGQTVLFEGQKVQLERAVAFSSVMIKSTAESEPSPGEGVGMPRFQTDRCTITEIRIGGETLKLVPARQ
jgi:hypothetical protein